MKIQHDPLRTHVASDEEVKRSRAAIESMPIRCSDGAVFDADADSLDRMKSIAQLLDLTGETEVWRMADNSERTLTASDMHSYLDEISKLKAERQRIVFRQYRALRENPDTTLRDLRNWEMQHLEHNANS